MKTILAYQLYMMRKKIEDTHRRRFMATTCADGFIYTPQPSLMIIDEEEVKKHFARHTLRLMGP